MMNEPSNPYDPSSPKYQEAVDVVRSMLRPSVEEARSIFVRWSKRAYWTLEEAAMLAVGLNPTVAPSMIERALPDEQAQFDEFLDLVKRRFPSGRVPPQEFADWNREQNIGVATEVVAVIEGQKPGRKPERRPTDIAKIQRSLERMVIAMAIDKYGYDPKDKKSSTGKSITSAVEKIGMTIADGAVLTRLREALDGDSADPKLAEAIDRYFRR